MYGIKALWVSMIVALALFVGGNPTRPDTDDPNNTGSGGYRGGGSLTQSIDMEDDVTGVLTTISYPDGWFAEEFLESNNVAISDNASFLTSIMEDELSSDEIPENTGILFIFFISSDMASRMGLEDAKTSAMDFAQFFTGQSESGESEVEAPREITVNDVTLAEVEFSDAETDSLMLFSRVGETYVCAIGDTRPGSLDDYQAAFEAIMASVTLTE